jgi:hypothetical protein
MSQTWQTFNEAAGGDSVYDALIYQRTRSSTLASMFSGTSAPSTPTPADGSPWFDTNTGAKALKIYIDSAWREVCVLGYTELTTAELGDDIVTQAKIADAAVGTSQLASSAVTAAILATDAVETAKIKDANVTAAKLATDAVTTTKIASANVTAAKLATDSVETAKIKDLNVTSGKLAANAVTTAKIADGAVTSDKLAAGAANWSVLAKSANYTTDAGEFIVATVSGDWTLTLPAAPESGDGVAVYVASVTTGFSLTVSGNGSNIGGYGSSVKLFLAGDRLELVYDGANWAIVSGTRSTPGIPDAVLEHQLAANTDGGNLPSDTWTVRPLNTEVRNVGGILTLSSNQFIPKQDGWVEWQNVLHDSYGTHTRLKNVTDGTVAGYGLTGHLPAYSAVLLGGCAVTAGKTYQLECYADIGDANGLGEAYGTSVVPERYARVSYWRN